MYGIPIAIQFVESWDWTEFADSAKSVQDSQATPVQLGEFADSNLSLSDQTCPSRSTVDHVVTSKSEISSVFPAVFSVKVQSPC